ncbi:MAG: TIGR04255 family protein [Planctomycetes bacterium]|nr:TIGR04255 family protein [Planctomycetota bacterium]
MTTQEPERPEFARPPVIEVALGVQWPPVRGVWGPRISHYAESLAGEGWKPHAEVAPVEYVEERLDGEGFWAPPGFAFSVVTGVAPRLQLIRDHDDRLLQIQNGWFVYNWRKTSRSGDYPRYGMVKEEFNRQLAILREFAERNTWNLPQPTLWEVTYVDRIEQGTVWQDPSDWARALPGLIGGAALSQSVQEETAQIQRTYRLPGNIGRLYVNLQHVLSAAPLNPAEEPLESLQITFTARGPLPSATGWSELENMFAGGHAAIVELFKAVSSETAKDYWRGRAQ